MPECKLFHKTLVYSICMLNDSHKVKCISSCGSQSKVSSHNVLYFSTKLSSKLKNQSMIFPNTFPVQKIFTVLSKFFNMSLAKTQIYLTITWTVIEQNWWLASKHLELSSSYEALFHYQLIIWWKLLHSSFCAITGFYCTSMLITEWTIDTYMCLSQMVSLACTQFTWQIICEI